MDFHFIKLNYNGTYLSLVDPNSKSRFVCFSDKDMAMKCVDYAAEFRARNRIWPSLDMSSENRKLELNEEVKWEQIQSKFKELVKKYHPDKNPNNPKAVEKFKELNNYNGVLDKKVYYTGIRMIHAPKKGGEKRYYEPYKYRKNRNYV